VSPVVDEVTEALQDVVGRNPGVFATVVVQEADTAWSVWIGEWDGTLRTRVTRLENDPATIGSDDDDDRHTLDSVAAPVTEPAPAPAPTAPAADPVDERAPIVLRPVPAQRQPVPAVHQPAHQVTPAVPVPPLPRRPVPSQYSPNQHSPAQPGPRSAPPVPRSAPPVPRSAPPLAAAQHQVVGPAMNDRVAGRIADLLRREEKRESHDVDA
jgi:hypothetical protein